LGDVLVGAAVGVRRMITIGTDLADAAGGGFPSAEGKYARALGFIRIIQRRMKMAWLRSLSNRRRPALGNGITIFSPRTRQAQILRHSSNWAGLNRPS
jgi:hypothetical protein